MLLCLFLAPMVLPSGEIGEFMSLPRLSWHGITPPGNFTASALSLSLSLTRLPRPSVPLEKGGDKRPGFPEEEEEGKQGVCHPKIKRIKKRN